MSNGIITKEQFEINPDAFTHLDLSIKLNRRTLDGLGIELQVSKAEDKKNVYEIEEKIKLRKTELNKLIKVRDINKQNANPNGKTYPQPIPEIIKSSLSPDDSGLNFEYVRLMHYEFGVNKDMSQTLVSLVNTDIGQTYENQMEYEENEFKIERINYYTRNMKDIGKIFSQETDFDKMEKYLEVIVSISKRIRELKSEVKSYKNIRMITEDINN